MSAPTSSKPAVFVPAPEPGERSLDRAAFGAAPPAVEAAAAADAEFDVRRMQAALYHAFDDAPPGQGEPAPAPAETKPSPQAPQAAPRSLLSRISGHRLVKVGVGLALVVIFGWMPLQTLLIAASVEAVVNSRIVTVRSPIDGVVAAAPHDFKAWSADKGAPVLRIRDDKADRSRLDDLSRQLGDMEGERPPLAQRLAMAQASLADLERQTRQFAEGRILQLNARIAALGHDVAAAAAKADEADAAFTRANALARSGVMTTAELGRLRRDRIVAVEERSSARASSLEEASVERNAAYQGVFVGDSYNDRPNSAQRADEMRLRVGDLAAELQARDAAIERLRAGGRGRASALQAALRRRNRASRRRPRLGSPDRARRARQPRPGSHPPARLLERRRHRQRQRIRLQPAAGRQPRDVPPVDGRRILRRLGGQPDRKRRRARQFRHPAGQPRQGALSRDGRGA